MPWFGREKVEHQASALLFFHTLTTTAFLSKPRDHVQEVEMQVFVLAVRICGMLLCAGFAPCVLAEENGLPIEIKEPGKKPYTLTITAIACAPDAAPNEKKAAVELGNYLNKMTGIKIPVKNLQPQDAGKNTLMIDTPAVEKKLISRKDLSWCGPEG
jgi:hypothetical protein